MAAETMRITEELVVEDKTGTGLESAERKVSEFDKTIQNTQKRLDKMTGSRWSMTVNAVDKATSVISAVESKLNSGIGKAWDFIVGVKDKATAPLQGIINLLKNPILQAGAILGISVSTKDILDTYGGFESTMSQVKALSGATGEDFDALTEKAKEMGATTKYTATESAEAFTYMAQAGWSTEEMISGIDGIMNLAASDGIELAEATDIVSNALSSFGMTASDTAHFADVLAVAASATNTDVSGLGEAFTYIAPVAGAMKYSVEDVSMALGLMSNNAVKGSMAGTSLKTALANLAAPTDKIQEAMDKYGISLTDSAGNMKSLRALLGNLRSSLGGLSEAEQTAAASTIFGKEAMAGMLAIINTADEDFEELTSQIDNADGAAKQMSETMLDNMEGSLTLLQSAADGAKLALGSRLAPYVRKFADWLTNKMPEVETTIGKVMDTVDEKIEALQQTIEDFTSSDEWANADIWGKISIAWDKIVAEPFSRWWDSTGKPWLTEKVSGIGETLGSGITSGLLALLGFDASGAVEDGKSVGESFIEGFKQGFDTGKIGEALTEWASDHKGVVAAAGVIAGGKLLGGIAKAFQGGKSLAGSIRGLFGGGNSDSSTGTGGLGDVLKNFSANTMTVTAGTVIVNGNSMSEGVDVIRKTAENATNGSAQTLLPAAGQALALPSAAGSTLALPGSTATVSEVLSLPGPVSTGSTGGMLELPGEVIESGAASAAGAAAAGAASIAGIVGGIAGIGSAIVDIFQGFSKKDEGDSKGAKDEFVTAGTKAGMVGTGAAAGAAIGSLVPVVGTAVGAAVGAGVGGVAALIGGNKAGKAISDSTDDGGALNKAGKAVGGFFTKTVPDFVTETLPSMASTAGSAIGEFASNAGDAIGGFFTETVPGFFTETLPDAASKAGAAITGFGSQIGETVSSFFTETVPSFLTETVPYAAGYVVGAAGTFFTQTVPEKFGELWDSVGNFFTETVPTWAESVFERGQAFFTETVPGFFGSLWESVSGFFTETIPTWAEGVFQKAQTFFTETIPGFFGSLWDSAYSFFTEALPTWADGIYQKAAAFFGETVPAFAESLWTDVSGFVTETIPEWANTAFTKVSTFFMETVPGFISSLWDNVTGFVTETIPSWGSSIASKVSGWWSSVSGWFDNLWGTISGNYSAGKEAGSGKHAEGGIMYAPHLAQVAEDGPEAIIPLGSADRARGVAVWEQAGDILGAGQATTPGIGSTDTGESPQNTGVGSNDTGIIPASTGSKDNGIGQEPVGSNDDGSNPEPVGSNDDGSSLKPTGTNDDGINTEPIGSNDDGSTEPSPAGTSTTGSGKHAEGGQEAEPIPAYTTDTSASTEATGASQDTPISVPVSLTINPEFVIQASDGGMNADDIVRLLKDRIREMVDDISDEMAERLARIFANMPVKGGA